MFRMRGLTLVCLVGLISAASRPTRGTALPADDNNGHWHGLENEYGFPTVGNVTNGTEIIGGETEEGINSANKTLTETSG
ncbi:hypothetical protein PAMP_011042 [Pampus punctatissimus]